MIGGGVSWARSMVAVVACVSALIVFSDSSHAANANQYCSAGLDPTKTGDTAPGSLLAVGDVKLWTGSTHTASDCYGAFDPGNSSPANETAAINSIFGDISSSADDFVYLDKTGDGNSANGLNGIRFVVHTYGGSDGAPGGWTILWFDTNGGASQTPLMIDLVVLLVGGNSSAAYLLSGVLLPTDPGIGFGYFDIQFVNGGGIQANSRCYDHDYGEGYGSHHHSGTSKNYGDKGDKDKDHCDKPNQPDISHLLIAGRIVATQIPEPATMGMFGVGLVGLWVASRRRFR